MLLGCFYGGVPANRQAVLRRHRRTRRWRTARHSSLQTLKKILEQKPLCIEELSGSIATVWKAAAEIREKEADGSEEALMVPLERSSGVLDNELNKGGDTNALAQIDTSNTKAVGKRFNRLRPCSTAITQNAAIASEVGCS